MSSDQHKGTELRSACGSAARRAAPPLAVIQPSLLVCTDVCWSLDIVVMLVMLDIVTMLIFFCICHIHKLKYFIHVTKK